MVQETLNFLSGLLVHKDSRSKLVILVGRIQPCDVTKLYVSIWLFFNIRILDSDIMLLVLYHGRYKRRVRGVTVLRHVT